MTGDINKNSPQRVWKFVRREGELTSWAFEVLISDRSHTTRTGHGDGVAFGQGAREGGIGKGGREQAECKTTQARQKVANTYIPALT